MTQCTQQVLQKSTSFVDPLTSLYVRYRGLLHHKEVQPVRVIPQVGVGGVRQSVVTLHEPALPAHQHEGAGRVVGVVLVVSVERVTTTAPDERQRVGVREMVGGC